MPSEADVQRTIIDALLWDGWMFLRINQGGMFIGQRKERYVKFAWWQHLNIDPQDSGIADVIALKLSTKKGNYTTGTIPMIFRLLAIEVKAPGRKSKVTHAQARFLAAIKDHGGIAIVADCLEDVEPYLDRVAAQ